MKTTIENIDTIYLDKIYAIILQWFTEKNKLYKIQDPSLKDDINFYKKEEKLDEMLKKIMK